MLIAIVLVLLLSYELYGVTITRTALRRCCLHTMQPSIPRLTCQRALTTQQVLHLPCPLGSIGHHAEVDDDHFCSILVDAGGSVHSLGERARHTGESHAECYEASIAEALQHLTRAQGARSFVVATGYAGMHLLRVLGDWRSMVTDLVDKVVLVDPPPLHAVRTEAGRMRLLQRFVNSLTHNKVPLRAGALKAVGEKRARGRRSGGGGKTDGVEPVVPFTVTSSNSAEHAAERMLRSFIQGELSSADLLGSTVPSGAAEVVAALGKSTVLVVCTDLLRRGLMSGRSGADTGDNRASGVQQCVAAPSAHPAVLGVRGRTQLSEFMNILAGADHISTDHNEGQRSAAAVEALFASADTVLNERDDWGPAAVEEVAALYQAQPVVHISSTGASTICSTGDEGDRAKERSHRDEIVVPENIAETAEWTEAVLARHAQLANIISLFLAA